MTAGVNTAWKGRSLADRHCVAVLPSYLQSARNENSMGHIFTVGDLLSPLPIWTRAERGPPHPTCCPKAGFEGGWAMNKATLS